MFKIMKTSLLVAGIAAMSALPAAAQFAIGAGGGTTGGTLEAQVRITDFIGLRANGNYLKFDLDETYDDIDYTADLDLNSIGAFVDLRPFSNSFLITGGAYLGDKKIDGNAMPNGPVEIGNQTFTPDQIGTLNLAATADDVAPFLGLGFDSTFQGEGHWGFKLIAGAMFSGTPEVSLTSTGGTLSDDPNFQAELENERQNLQDDVDDFEVYPVLQLGLTYRF